jgi:hypothetical protein
MLACREGEWGGRAGRAGKSATKGYTPSAREESVKTSLTDALLPALERGFCC